MTRPAAVPWCAVCFNRPATNGVRCDDCSAAWCSPISHARAVLNTEPPEERHQ
jgi:hypothetical protein